MVKQKDEARCGDVLCDEKILTKNRQLANEAVCLYCCKMRYANAYYLR